MSLKLEVASHLAAGEARVHVQEAQALNHKLLGDVRDAVSTLRGDVSIDLGKSIRGFTDGIRRPRIHLALPEDLDLDDPLRAHALLRCAQEIITNAIRHARAQNLWLEMRKTPDGITLTARDDGRGARAVRPGSGLKGMRERLEEVGGRLKLAAAPQEGFRVDVWLPLRGAAR
ncbi:MAG: sensor histidine kinase [Acidobacteriota bacterium]